MVRLFTLVATSCCLAFVSSASKSFSADRDGFESWKALHGKSYSTDDEETSKFNTWLRNRDFVEQHNKRFEQGETSFRVALNRLGDLSSEEYRQTFLSPPPVERAALASSTFTSEQASQLKTPSSWNWVDEMIVPDVKDQGQCGMSDAESLPILHFISPLYLLSVPCAPCNRICSSGV